MSLVKPQGSLTWPASVSPDTVSYNLYQDVAPTVPTYSSSHVNVGNVLTVNLPVEGLPAVEGSVNFGIAAVDGVGNISDITMIANPVLIDVTPPAAPTEIVYSVSPN